MKRKPSTTKSLTKFIQNVRGTNQEKRTRKGGVGKDSSLAELRALQEKAQSSREAEKLEEEYKVAKTGIKSRYGKIAKAFGLDAKSAAELDKVFGKKVDDQELKKLREKFKIKSEEEKKQEKEKAAAEKAAKAEKQAKKEEKRDQQINDILDSVGKIYGMVNEIRLSVEGIANKLKAGKAKEIVAKDGKYFDPEGKRIKKGDIEKKAGLTYSKETKRYHDVKTGKMVGKEEADRRMNLSPTAKKMAAGGVGTGAVTGVAVATATHMLESKSIDDKPKEGDSKLEGEVEGIGKKLDEQEKKSKGMFDFFKDPSKVLSKALYGALGGAIGGVVGGLFGAFKIFMENLTAIRKFLSDISFTIPEIKIPQISMFGIKFGGAVLFNKREIHPFGFLKPKEEPAPAAPAAPAPEAAKPAAPEAAPAPEAAKPAAPEAAPAAPTPAAPAAAAAPTPEPEEVQVTAQKVEAPAAAPTPPAPTPAAPPPPAPAAPTAAPAGTSMPGGAAPKKQAPAATGPKVSGMDDVKKMIKQHEGVRYEAYKDTKGLWTIGVGHLIGDGSDAALEKSGYKGRKLTEKEVDDLFDEDFAHHVKIAEKTPGWSLANDTGKAAMIDLAFNMGAWWQKFKNTAKSLASGDFSGAAEGLTNSGWFKQVGKRAQRVVAMIRNGDGSNGNGAKLAATSQSQSGAKLASVGGEAAASPTGGGAPTVAPTASPVAPTPSSGPALAATTTAVSAAKDEAAAANAGGTTVAPVQVASSGPTKAIPPNNSSKANARQSDNSFNRAIAKDFSHPSTFNSVA